MINYFEKISSPFAQSPFLVTTEGQISFAELVAKAEQLRANLSTISPNNHVVIFVNNQVDRFIMFMAVLHLDIRVKFIDCISYLKSHGDPVSPTKTLLITDSDLLSIPRCEILQIDMLFRPSPHSNSPPITNGFLLTLIEKDNKSTVIDQELLAALSESVGKAISSTTGNWLVVGKSTLLQFFVETLAAFLQQRTMVFAPDVKSALTLIESPDQFNMEFSTFFFGSSKSEDAEVDRYRLLKETVRIADQQRFTGVWTPERHFNSFGGLYPNPSVLGAALAAMTQHVQIRCGSIVTPLHHSVRIAEDWSVIDNLSNGRAAVSFASGWQCDDYIFAPKTYPVRHEYMYKQIKEIQQLWRGEKLEYENGLGKKVQVGIFPRPVQRSLPFWVTVSGKTESFYDAGKIGANVLTHLLWQDTNELVEKIQVYRNARKEHGFNPSDGKVTTMVHTFMAQTDEDALPVVKSPLIEYIRSSVSLIESLVKSNSFSSKDADTIGRYGNLKGEIPPEVLNDLLEIAFQRFFSSAALLGSEAKCAALLKKLKSFGVDEVACLIDFGVDEENVIRSLQRLAEFKIPYDRRLHPKINISVVRLFNDDPVDASEIFEHRTIQTVIRDQGGQNLSVERNMNQLNFHYDLKSRYVTVEAVSLGYFNERITEDF